MAIRAFDGSTWQNQKSLRIYDGSLWRTAKQAWVYTGTQWSIMYPEFPLNTAAPSISTTSGTSGIIGCVYSVTLGSWNAQDAYAATTYSYQWTRNGTDIFNATGSSYTTVGADAEQTIGCRITATNLRGSTPITVSTGVMMLPAVISVSTSDSTITPGQPSSVTLNSPTGLSYTGSWAVGSNATTYDGYGGGFAGTPSFNYSARTFSGTGTAGNAVIFVRSVNTNKQILVSWPAAPGAATYDVHINGSFFYNVPSTTTSITQPVLDTAGYTFTVYPRTTNFRGTGATGSVTSAADKFSAYTQSNVETLFVPNATSPTFANATVSASNLSVSWGGATNAVKYRVYWTLNSAFSGDSNSIWDAPEWTSTSASYNGAFQEGSTYYFFISAAGNNGVWTPYGSFKASGVVPYTAPGTPSPSTSSITNVSFTTSWASVPGASSYSVKIGTFSGGSNIVNTTTTSTSYNATGLSANTPYFVTVAAFKDGWGYGGDGTATATTQQNPPSIGVPTVQFERTSTQIKWGIDNPTFSGAFTPFGIEWEVRSAAGGGTAIANSTINYTTSMTRGPVNGFSWNYWVRSTTDLPFSTAARFLRCRLYGQNDITFAIVNGPWSTWL